MCSLGIVCALCNAQALSAKAISAQSTSGASYVALTSQPARSAVAGTNEDALPGCSQVLREPHIAPSGVRGSSGKGAGL